MAVLVTAVLWANLPPPPFTLWPHTVGENVLPGNSQEHVPQGNFWADSYVILIAVLGLWCIHMPNLNQIAYFEYVQFIIS